MRGWMTAALAAVAALGVAAITPNSAAAASAAAAGVTREAAALHMVQYYGPRHHEGERARHRHWREHRRARDEARIAAAARREAIRIERERAERRAWRQAQHEHHSFYRGY
jgi:hypothetical protein